MNIRSPCEAKAIVYDKRLGDRIFSTETCMERTHPSSCQGNIRTLFEELRTSSDTGRVDVPLLLLCAPLFTSSGQPKVLSNLVQQQGISSSNRTGKYF